MDEASTTDSDSILDEIEAAIRSAAAGQKVVLIRLEVGRDVTVSRIEIAKEMHRKFPDASVELGDAKAKSDSVVVKDIEVE